MPDASAGEKLLEMACDPACDMNAALELVRAGAALDVKDAQGRTALQAARDAGHGDLVRAIAARQREEAGASLKKTYGSAAMPHVRTSAPLVLEKRRSDPPPPPSRRG